MQYGQSLVKSDTEIASAVLNTLKWYSAIDQGKVKVKVENGIVTLYGDVDWNFPKTGIADQRLL